MASEHGGTVLVDAGFVRVIAWSHLPKDLVALVGKDQVAIARLDTGQVMVLPRPTDTKETP